MIFRKLGPVAQSVPAAERWKEKDVNIRPDWAALAGSSLPRLNSKALSKERRKRQREGIEGRRNWEWGWVGKKISCQTR